MKKILAILEAERGFGIEFSDEAVEEFYLRERRELIGMVRRLEAEVSALRGQIQEPARTEEDEKTRPPNAEMMHALVEAGILREQ